MPPLNTLTFLAVALGGAVGASLRFMLYRLFATNTASWIPYATLLVNVLGSFLLGLLVGWSGQFPIWLRTGLAVGVLGSFTTFSTFSVETLSLIDQGAWFRAIAFVLLNVLLCLGAAWMGIRFGSQSP